MNDFQLNVNVMNQNGTNALDGGFCLFSFDFLHEMSDERRWAKHIMAARSL